MQAKHLRILGVLLLALIGIMAVNASAAQARWLLLLNGASVNSIDVNNVELRSRLLVNNGIEIECNESTGSVKWSTSEESKALSASSSSTSTGCVELNFGEICDVKSVGLPAGSIAISVSGPVGMESAETLMSKMSFSKSTDVVFEGEECPLEGIDGHLDGLILKTLLNALQNVVTRLTHLTTSNFTFGEEEAILESSEGGPVLGHETHVGGGTWAFHLVNL